MLLWPILMLHLYDGFLVNGEDEVFDHIKCMYRLLAFRILLIVCVSCEKEGESTHTNNEHRGKRTAQPSAHADQNERKQNTHIVWKGALPQ